MSGLRVMERAAHCCVWALFSLFMPAVALAAFTAPVPFSKPQGVQLTDVAAAVRPDGSVVLAWRQGTSNSTRVEMRVRNAAGALGAIRALSPATGAIRGSVGVMVDNEGDVIIHWVYQGNGPNQVFQARSFSASGVLGPLQVISDPRRNSTMGRGDVDADGDALFVWFDDDEQRLNVRSRTKAGALGAIQEITAPNVYTYAPPVVGVSRTGHALIAWMYRAPENRTPLQGRTRSASGALGPVVEISPKKVAPGFPEMAVDANGNGFIVWSAQVDVEGTRLVQGRTFRANGSVGPVINLTSELPASAYTVPNVAVNAAGRTAVIWTQCTAPETLTIRTSATGTTGGAFSPPIRLSPARECGESNGTSVAIDGGGNALVAWETAPVGDRIRIRILSSKNVLKPIQTFVRSESDSARAAMNLQGKAAVVWRRGPFGNSLFEVTTGP